MWMSKTNMKRESAKAVATVERSDFAFALAIAGHVVAFWSAIGTLEPAQVAAAQEASTTMVVLETIEPTPLEPSAGAMSRFRPRTPAPAPEKLTTQDAPAAALWAFQCSYAPDLARALGLNCPAEISALTPSAQTYSHGELQELFDERNAQLAMDDAAIARGWMKAPQQSDEPIGTARDGLGPYPWDETGASSFNR